MRLIPSEILMDNLLNKYDKDNWLYVPKEEAYEQLKYMTEEDFGYDAKKWREWFEEAEDPVRQIGYFKNKLNE